MAATYIRDLDFRRSTLGSLVALETWSILSKSGACNFDPGDVWVREEHGAMQGIVRLRSLSALAPCSAPGSAQYIAWTFSADVFTEDTRQTLPWHQAIDAQASKSWQAWIVAQARLTRRYIRRCTRPSHCAVAKVSRPANVTGYPRMS